MKIVNLPEYWFDNPNDLLKFYGALGWNKDKLIRTEKVFLNESDWECLIEQLALTKPEGIERGTFIFDTLGMLPNYSKAIEPGKVKLINGWLRRK